MSVINPQIESFKMVQVLLEIRISTSEKYNLKDVEVWFSTHLWNWRRDVQILHNLLVDCTKFQ